MIVQELFETVESSARHCERLSRAIVADAQDMDLDSASESAQDLEYIVNDIAELLFEIDTILRGGSFKDNDLTGDEARV